MNTSGFAVNHDACLRLLLVSEADVNTSVNQEWLALNKFAFTGNYKCVELLDSYRSQCEQECEKRVHTSDRLCG